MREPHHQIEMDVTFTNALEGVRQYFQGLPTGSNENIEINQQRHQQQSAVAATEPSGGNGAPAPSPQTGGTAPNYPTYDPPPPTQPQFQAQGNTSTENGRSISYTWPERERVQKITNYPIQNTNSFVQSDAYPWSGHDRTQGTRSNNDRTQAYWSQDVKRLQNHAQTHENHQKVIQNHYQNPQTSTQYQYPTHQAYSYVSVVQPNHSQNTTIRTQTRTEVLMSNHIKPSTNMDNHYISNGYPVASRSQDAISKNPYPMVQTIQKTSNIPSSSESLRLNGYTQSAYYPTQTKTPITATSNTGYQSTSNPYNQYSHQYPMYETNSKTDRRTHNLPPIAGITSANYHAKSTREGVSAKVVPNPASTIRTSYSATVSNQSRPSAIYTHHSRTNSFTSGESSTQNSQYQYQYPLSVSNNPNSSAKYQKSSYPTQQYFQKPIKVENHTGTTQNQQVINPVHQNVLEAIKKRESPLDLSVKTVRTIADSTALDDVEHEQRFHKPYRRVDGKYIYQNGSYVVNQQNIPRPASVQNIQSAAAPRVDFLPNFSATALQNQNQSSQHYQYTKAQEVYNQNRLQQEYYKNSQQAPNLRHSSSIGAGASTYQVSRTNDTKETLPRFELPIEGSYKKPQMPYPNINDVSPRKRTSSESMVASVIPAKLPKGESWREKIDQQIEQKLSTYDQNRMPDPKGVAQFAKPNNQRPNSSQFYHNSAYKGQVPLESHQNSQYPSSNIQYDMYVMNPLHRSNSTSKLVSPKLNSPNNGGANKAVLSILRNSLEIKGAKEAQKKLDQMKPTGVQHPTTDVTAPLQPKPGIHSRQNVSPFTAASLDRNSNTPPNYKFHCPRAVDSIKFDIMDTVIKQEIIEKYPQNSLESHPVGASTGASTGASIGASTGASTGANTGAYFGAISGVTSGALQVPNASEGLDGLAAFLAARIRTKGERKQLTSSELLQLQRASEQILDRTPTHDMQNRSGNSSSGGSPPKLYREQTLNTPSRRKLFIKSDEDVLNQIPAPINCGSIAHRNTLRSSSETSVFDFRDSDSEGEMPVLERQSLEDMRRDRKSLSNRPLVSDSMNNVVKNEEQEDSEWAEMCSKFCEQLVNNNMGKKKGRRKKQQDRAPEPIKVEIEEKENVIENISIKQEIIDEPVGEIKETLLEAIQIKKEVIELTEIIEPTVLIQPKELIQRREPIEETKPPPIHKDNSSGSDSDSDVPLTSLQRTIKKEKILESDDDEPLTRKKEKIGAKQRIEYSSSDSEEENTPQTRITRNSKKLEITKKLPTEEKKMVLRSADSSPVKQPVIFIKKKAVYGDGSDFRPGWEEELYQYKRSIRMPVRLISVTKPHWHRMSTSLPDLDACSPAPSSITDDNDFNNVRNKQDKHANAKQIKKELLDSDSNSSFTKNDDKLLKKKGKNSIVDVLVERVGQFKKKRNKSKDNKNAPKIIEKSSKLLLDTPSLRIKKKGEEKKKKGKPKESEDTQENEAANSVYLGYFRKKTVYNFREQFQKSCGNMVGEQFSTVVLQSRTRKETRVMKQRATIREVFGEDRPASAPPMTCHEDDIKTEKVLILSEEKTPEKETKDADIKAVREGLRSANSQVKKTYHVTRKYTFKNPPNSETNSIASTDEIIIKSETPSINGDETSDTSALSSIKRKYKLTKMRRKFSSGFDYIRKKKKVIKKEGSEDGDKPKRRGFPSRQDPECEEDIAKEIKSWVMNKGVGETHLHRAARLGYCDVTAYCLEKLDHYPSPKDNAGFTPLHEACARGHLDIAKLLLSYGANASESAQGGVRPLHEAAENGYVEIVRLLLSYGADPRLATYAGLTPLPLATDEDTKYILENFISDMEGRPTSPWIFKGPATCFDNDNSGFDPMVEAPSPEPESDDSDFEMEISENPLPNVYTFRNEPHSEQWILLQDLSNILKVKSRDALLKQISPDAKSNKTLVRQMKFNDFVEKSICCTLMFAGEKVNARSSKIALIKYTDKVKKLLGIENFMIPAS